LTGVIQKLCFLVPPALIFIYYKDVKTPNITQFGALAGQIQHMAAQKVGFTPRLLRQVAVTCVFQA